jgi:hypothetical protein
MVPGRINFRVREEEPGIELDIRRPIDRQQRYHTLGGFQLPQTLWGGLQSINSRIATSGHPAKVQAWNHGRESDRCLVEV